MIETRDARDPRAQKHEEWAQARAERQDAQLEYVAMMADVELPGDEEADHVDVCD